MKIAITGANSSVGVNLLGHVERQPDLEAVAIVRSDRAASQLPPGGHTVAVADYSDASALEGALAGVDAVIHLPGILFESKTTTYQSANVDTVESVAGAARSAGVDNFIFISSLGADPGSRNPYYASKGSAERHAQADFPSSTVIRTGMLLGPGAGGADALVETARDGTISLLGGGEHRLRPLDLDDLSAAMIAAARSATPGNRVLQLVGPETVTHRDLTLRFAEMAGFNASVAKIPVPVAKLGAGITSLFRTGGFTPDVIDVITDDEVVESNGDTTLGISLTPLETTLEKILPGRGTSA